MADVAKRFIGPSAPDTTARTYYTVPASTTVIIRNIHVVGAALATGFYMSIGTFSQANALYNGYVIPSAGALDWSGFLVMTAGEFIQVKADSNAQLTLTVSGIEVS